MAGVWLAVVCGQVGHDGGEREDLPAEAALELLGVGLAGEAEGAGDAAELYIGADDEEGLAGVDHAAVEKVAGEDGGGIGVVVQQHEAAVGAAGLQAVAVEELDGDGGPAGDGLVAHGAAWACWRGGLWQGAGQDGPTIHFAHLPALRQPRQIAVNGHLGHL